MCFLKPPAKPRAQTSDAESLFVFTSVCMRAACEKVRGVKGCIVVASRKGRPLKVKTHCKMTVGRTNGKKVFEGVKAVSV